MFIAQAKWHIFIVPGRRELELKSESKCTFCKVTLNRTKQHDIKTANDRKKRLSVSPRNSSVKANEHTYPFNIAQTCTPYTP